MDTTAFIPRALKDRVDRELEPGERVVWVDRSVPRFFTVPATGAFLFSLPWLAFACWWVGVTWFATTREGGIGDGFQFFPLFGLPFIIIGLLMMSAPLWAYYASRKAV